jgi:TPR repeat protein
MKLTWATAVVAVVASSPASAQDMDAGLSAYENHDYATAMKEWRPLAEGGNARAQFLVALLYYDGKAVAQDYGEAAKWFEQSADRGYTRAQYNLGEMYATGQGVKRDYVLAYKWESLCAASGNDTCADHRAWLAKKLKASQLTAAQRMAREWKPVGDGKAEAAPKD